MNIILSLYPNTRGLGFSCINLPKELMDSGVVTISPVSNTKLLYRIIKFIEFYKPIIIVTRDGNVTGHRGRRIASLLNQITEFAIKKEISVYQYSREQMKETFALFGATTKYEIALKIIEWIPALESYAPKIKQAWMNEDYNMGVFDAVALSFTFIYFMK